MPSLNQQAINFLKTYNQLLPDEGPRMLPLALDFTAADQYTLDYTVMQQRGFMSMVQGMFVDNADNTAFLTVTIRGSQQRIVIKPHTQGYYPLLAPNPFYLTFDSVGGPANVQVCLLNMPVIAGQWSTI